MLRGDDLATLAGGAAVSAAVAWIYLPIPLFVVPAAIAGAFKIRRAAEEKKRAASKKRERAAFETFLEAFAASASSGIPLVPALEEACEEVSRSHPGTILDGAGYRFRDRLKHRIRLEEAIEALSEGEEDEVRRFCEYLLVVRRRGADPAGLADDFRRLLADNRSLEREREVCLNSMRREQRLLFAMPPILILGLRLSGIQKAPGIIDVIIRLICLILFWIAARWSSSIVSDVKPDWKEIAE